MFDVACVNRSFCCVTDVIYEDTGSPENSCDLRKEQQDRLCPLMGKGRFKMKPKGLLERLVGCDFQCRGTRLGTVFVCAGVDRMWLSRYR